MRRGDLGGGRRRRCYGYLAKTTDISIPQPRRRFTMRSREMGATQSSRRSVHTATTAIASSTARAARRFGGRESLERCRERGQRHGRGEGRPFIGKGIQLYRAV